MTLSELSAASQAAFVAALDGVFEHSSWVAATAWSARPFATLAGLHAALSRVVADAEPERQLALLRAHPELAGRTAARGELTEASRREQDGAGLGRGSPEALAVLTRLNAAYVEKFGFPFVIAVRGHTPASIIEELARRIEHGREAELDESLRQIEQIAWLRLQDRVQAA